MVSDMNDNTKPLFEQYETAVSYIMEIPRFSAKNDPLQTAEFLKLVGEDTDACVIHVAGTNGKGSVCAYLNSVYRCQGRKTGMFTSPHLVDIRERIRINDELISKEDFVKCANRIMVLTEEFDKTHTGYHPSFFEFLFFMAVYWFRINRVDVAIYETGLGGRLDATNSLTHKDICVITSIGMDHMEYLGNTIREIAGEKAGIIQKGVPVVFCDNNPEVTEVIADKAAELGAKAYPVDTCEKNICGGNKKNIDFSYKYRYDSNAIFTVQTCAHYQVNNAALALRTLQILQGEDIIDSPQVTGGISSMFWPGRMEEIEDNVFVDGGHNVPGIEAFIESVANDGCEGKRYLLFSAVSDKQVRDMIGLLVRSELFEGIGICPIDSYRATDIAVLGRYFKECMEECKTDIKVYEFDDTLTAYNGMCSIRRNTDDRTYICGSLYLVGAIKAIRGQTDD